MASKILKIGLTGGIGCGKSQVRKQLAERGVPTIDADTVSRQIAAADARAIAAIKQKFGDDVYAPDGTLQRHILATRVFGDSSAIAALNAILHPLVFEYTDEQVAHFANAGEKFVVIEAALFYETGWHKQMDKMVVVTAPMNKRLVWLLRRDGVSHEQIRARMAHQIPVEKKAAQADFIIDNNGTLADLARAVGQLLDKLRKLAIALS
ncbi:MAG: dephospho-CoA kinase [Deferribacteres bacterium]|nr:dephospho-CoA kinase [candidate division KSB1 bacterium]MCB9509500.1 dephospho-CoA kinase [Deferribacteres bacterium]